MAKPIYKISQWDEEGNWDEHPVGAFFENIYLSTEYSEDNAELYPTDFTLLDLYNHYQSMLAEAQYVYCGTEEPQNTNVKLWYDYIVEEDPVIEEEEDPIVEEETPTE